MGKQKTYTTKELLAEMETIVNKKVKAYDCDFIVDKKIINEIAEENEDVKFLWIVRRDGTHIVKENEEDYLKAIRFNYKDRTNYTYIEYQVELKRGLWTMKKAYESKIKELEYAFGSFRLTVLYKGNDFAQVTMKDISKFWELIWSTDANYKTANEWIKNFKANGYFEMPQMN